MNDTKPLRKLSGRFAEALLRAIRKGDDPAVGLLMAKLDPSATDKLGDTALMQVLRFGGHASDISAPIDLLLPITDTTIRNSYGEDALLLSAKYSTPGVFAGVLSRSDPAPSYSCPDESILHVAADEYAGKGLARGEQVVKIAMLWADPRVDANRTNEYGDTALHVACDFRDDASDRVNALLAKVDPTIVNDKGRTVLMIAAKRGHAESVMSLIPVSDPLAQDKRGMTPLMHAAARGDVACLTALAPHSELNHADDFGNAAIHLASVQTNRDALSSLLRMPRLNANAVDKEGRSALFHAVTAREAEFVNLLLTTSRVDPTLQDRNGQTALHVAATVLNRNIVDALMVRVDPRVVDRLGRTAADIAAQQEPSKGREDIVRMLSDAAFALDERTAIAGATVPNRAAVKPKARSL